MRPYPEEDSAAESLSRGQFVGADRLITFFGTKHAHLWPLPEFQSDLEFRCRGKLNVWPSPSGSHIFINEGGRITVIDVRKGEFGGAIEAPPDLKGQMTITDVSFRDDGAAIAALMRLPSRPGLFLAVWDLTTGKLQHFHPIFAGEKLAWAGEKFVLVKLPESKAPPAKGMLSNAFETRLRLVDITTGRTAWKYRIDKGEAAMRLWGGRLWYATQADLTSPYTIASAIIPSEETRTAIASAPEPKVLFGPGAKVSLKTSVEIAWDPLADKAVEEKMRAKLVDLLKKRGVEVVDNAPLTITAILEEKGTGRVAILPIGGPLAILSRARIEIHETLLHCTVKLSDATDDVWKNGKAFDLTKEEIEMGVPEEKNPQTHYRELQANNLMTWLEDAAIPKEVYEGWYYNGLGESELGPIGEKVTSRAEPKK